jgi:hypothetical protein
MIKKTTIKILFFLAEINFIHLIVEMEEWKSYYK